MPPLDKDLKIDVHLCTTPRASLSPRSFLLGFKCVAERFHQMAQERYFGEQA